ncbi:MAG: O-antigen ligase family protein [Roseobacter sp.]
MTAEQLDLAYRHDVEQGNRHLFKNKGEGWLLTFWFLLPILGQVTAAFFLLTAPFFRNRTGSFRDALVVFSVICAVYTLYIFGVSAAYGGMDEAIEPAGDALSLFLTVAVSTWVVRSQSRINPHHVYMACVLVLIIMFLLLAFFAVFMGQERPGLLMKNPLNLSPLLLVPIVFCTFWQFAPSKGWIILGVVAFVMGFASVATILEARGTTLVLAALLLTRLIWGIFDAANVRHSLRNGAFVLGILIAVLSFAFFNNSIGERFQAVTEAFELQENMTADGTDDAIMNATSDTSVNQRLAMLIAGWNAFKERPIFGYGGQNRFDAAVDYLPGSFAFQYSHLHNEFVTHAVAGGIPAVVLLTVILFFPVYVACRTPGESKNRMQIAAMFTLAFVGTAFFNNVLFNDISAFSLGLSYVFAVLVLESV